MDMLASCTAIVGLLQEINGKYTKATGSNYTMHGVTAPQAQILLLISRAGPLKISDIAKKLSMAESNVTNICKRLEKSGYVQRVRQQDDQRMVLIEPTALSEAKATEMKDRISAFFEEMSRYFNQDDIADIENSLQKLNQIIDMFLASKFMQ